MICPHCQKNPLPLRSYNRNGRTWVGAARSLCYCCYMRQRRQRDPASDVFYRLKRRAKHIGVPFGFTREGFKKLMELYPHYLERRGSASDALNIDRIHEPLGYVPGNLRIITKRENVVKENKRRAGAELDFSEDPDWNV